MSYGVDQAFDNRPWTRLTHAQRAEYLTALAGYAALAETFPFEEECARLLPFLGTKTVMLEGRPDAYGAAAD